MRLPLGAWASPARWFLAAVSGDMLYRCRMWTISSSLWGRYYLFKPLFICTQSCSLTSSQSFLVFHFKSCVIARSLLCSKYLDVNMLNFFPVGALPLPGLPVMPSFLRSGHKTVGMKLFFRLSKDLRTVHPGKVVHRMTLQDRMLARPLIHQHILNMKGQHLRDTVPVSQSLCPYNNHGQIGR